MSIWKITLAAAALGVGIALAIPQAFAQEPATAAAAKVDPARIAAAKDLLQAMGGGDQARASIGQFVEALILEIRQKDESVAAPASLFLRSETQPDRPRVKTYLADVEEAAATFYAERFTVEELKAVADFQRSAAGRKFQAETPQLMSVMIPRITKFQQGLIEDMQKGLTLGRQEEKGAAPK